MVGSKLLRLNIHVFIFLKQLIESMRRHTKTSLQRYKLRHYNTNLSFPSESASDFILADNKNHNFDGLSGSNTLNYLTAPGIPVL